MHFQRLFFLFALFCFAPFIVSAGDIDSPGTAPSAGSGIYSLNTFYNYLINGTAVSVPGTFYKPDKKPADSSKTINDIHNDIKTKFDACDATPDKVLSGVTFFSTDPAAWGPLVGTLSVIKYEGIPRTGQTPTVPVDPAPAGSDGNLGKGFPLPAPRFTDNNDGTVSDNLTGLVWLKNTACFKYVSWEGALMLCNSLHDGQYNLTDGSTAGDWRVPNLRELLSLFDYRYASPALSNTAGTGQWSEGDPFTGVTEVSFYRSSTVAAFSTLGDSWGVFSDGTTSHTQFDNLCGVWPVRGGE